MTSRAEHLGAEFIPALNICTHRQRQGRGPRLVATSSYAPLTIWALYRQWEAGNVTGEGLQWLFFGTQWLSGPVGSSDGLIGGWLKGE